MFLNKKILIFLISFWLLNTYYLKAQELFIPLKSQGKIPSALLTPTYKKISQDKSDDNPEFLSNIHYGLSNIFGNGRILFGDRVSSYVKQVSEEFLKRSGNTNYIDKLSYYTITSSKVNAFSTHQGAIFVTTGLLAQLENQDQLAFVLAHEISHYIKKHVKNTYISNKKILQKHRYDSFNKKTFDNIKNKITQFSRSQELEADRVGVDLYLSGQYPASEIEKVLHVLEFSHLPFDELDFTGEIFNTKTFKLPDSYFNDKWVSYIEDNSEESDTLSSHPNISKRIENLVSIFDEKEIDNSELRKKIIPNKDFLKIQNICRYNNLEYDLLDGNYSKAYYEAFLLEKLNNDYPKYLKNIKAKALYAASKIDTYLDHHPEQKDTKKRINFRCYEGQLNLAHNVIHTSLGNKALNILAIRELAKADYTRNQEYIKDLLLDLYIFYDFDTSSVNLKFQKIIPIKEENQDLSKMTKVEKLRLKQQNQKKEKLDSYQELQNSLVDVYKQHPEFRNIVLKTKSESKYNNRLTKLYEKEASIQKLLEDDKYKIDVPNIIPINKLVLLDPSAIYGLSSFFYRSKKWQEKKDISYVKSLYKPANAIGLDLVLLKNSEYQNTSIDFYNQEIFLNKWFLEFNKEKKFGILPLLTRNTKSFKDKFKTSYVLLNHFTYGNVLPNRKTTNLALGIFNPLITLSSYLSPRKDVLYSNVVIDIELRKIHYRDYKVMRRTMNWQEIQAINYELFQEIQN
jgi:Zn-dependent protease with chaperone function